MFDHPQFTYDRYAQEMHRVDERNEMIRVIHERREADAAQKNEPRRRGWFRRRRENRMAAVKTAPVIPDGVGSAASAIGR